MDQAKFYRNWVDSDLIRFAVRDDETDMLISAETNLENKARKIIHRYRKDIIDYIKQNPEFQTSLKPLPLDKDAPSIVKSMLKAAKLTYVGPMAAVAGAISEFTGKNLLEFTNQIILENGGDIFIKVNEEKRVAIYAGSSPLSGKIAIRIKPEFTPLGICTSSGTVGHSLSFGKADALCVLAKDTSLADACATAACNKIKGENDIHQALELAKSIEGIMGAVVIYKNKIGSIGEIELI